MSVKRPRRSRLLRVGIGTALLGIGLAISATPLLIIGSAQASVVAEDPTDPAATDTPTSSDSPTPTEEASPADPATLEPTEEPTEEPEPSPSPTKSPKPPKPAKPTPEATDEPTDEATDNATDEPTDEATDNATDEPTDGPTDEPTDEPTDDVTDGPTDGVTDEPTDDVTDGPTDGVTDEPTDESSAASDVSISIDGSVGEGVGSLSVSASGAGLAPGSRVEVWVFSTPVLLTTGTADDTGSFTVTASLPADLPPGDHSLVLRGTGADGQPVEVASGFSIGPDGTLTSANQPVDTATLASLTSTIPALPTSAKAPPYAPVQALDNPSAVVTTTIASLAVVSVVGAAAGAASAARGSSGGSGGGPGGAAGDDPAGGGINEGNQKRHDEVPDAASSERSWRSSFTPQGTAWGDHSALHRMPLTSVVDEASYRLPLAVATTSPLLGRIAGDAAPVRAMLGSASLVLPFAGLVVGVVAAVNGDGIAQPPALGFLIALIAIGILDALSGLISATAFSAVVVLSGGIIGWDSVRTLLGVALLIVGPGLIGSSFRSIRRVAGTGSRYVWERLTDLVVVPLFAAYVTYNIATSLPPLGGSLFPIADQAMTLSVLVVVMMVLKVLLEEVASRWFPERLATVLPRELPEPGVAQQAVSAGVRTAIFLFISAAFVGNVWQLWVAGVLFLIPAVLEPFADRFPNAPGVWRVVPEGVSLLALILLISLVISNALSSSMTDGALYARMAFVILLIPDLVLGVMGVFGRHGRDGEVRWYLRPNLVALYRMGGIVMLLVAAWLVVRTSGG